VTRARNTIVVCSALVGLAVISWTLLEVSRTDTATHPDSGEQRRPIARPGPENKDASMLPGERPDSSPKDDARKNPLRRTLQQKYGRTSAESDAAEAVADEQERPGSSLRRSAAEIPPASWSSLPEEYVMGILREQLIPVAKSCYEDVAPKGTKGKLTLSVAVIGDADIGGVIDRIDVNHTATSIEGELTECVRQAAYDMEFEPPEAGQGVQAFDFSIEFSVHDRDALK
jgi:hypothetical protein